ncbi:hypothetical protein TorRG33x02_045190 [Trema orientale]|uniref:Uncharacterized protein n=1 Tax=Trema orientale TaxID=63057 RepID=A0A2P5FPN0_TREOI|nr:hypothetical protein TorRG33x02_045190 [Trema orientale]
MISEMDEMVIINKVVVIMIVMIVPTLTAEMQANANTDGVSSIEAVKELRVTICIAKCTRGLCFVKKRHPEHFERCVGECGIDCLLKYYGPYLTKYYRP